LFVWACLGPAGRAQDFPNQESRILDKLPYSVEAVGYSKDGKWFAAAGGEAVRVWETSAWEVVVTFKDFEHQIRSVAFSPDGKTLAACGAGEYARLYDTAKWMVRRRLGSYSQLVYLDDGKTLVTRGGGSFVFLVNPASGAELHDFQWPNQFLARMALSPDGKVLAGGAARGAVALYDLRAQKVLAQLKGHGGATVTTVGFSPDGKTLITADPDAPGEAKAFLWDVAKGRRMHELDLQKAKLSMVKAAAFSPDGKTVALVSGLTPFVYLFDVATGELGDTLTTGDAPSSNSVAFAPDGRTLVTGCSDGSCLVWDVPKRKKAAPPR
jgi:WD40 repeat protein